MADKHSSDGTPPSAAREGRALPGGLRAPGYFQSLLAFRDHCVNVGHYHTVKHIDDWLKWNG